MKRPLLIALLGVDGSGKTTQARDLALWLTAGGTPAQYFENAGGRPVTDALARRLGRRDTRHLIGARGRVAIESTIRWLAILRSLLCARLTGRVAVMDRYAYCQYALIAARDDRGGHVARRVFGVFRAPDLVLYCAVPAEVAQRRVEARGRDRETVAYLQAFADAYAALPEMATFIVIDATGTPAEVAAAIQSAVSRRLSA